MIQLSVVVSLVICVDVKVVTELQQNQVTVNRTVLTATRCTYKDKLFVFLDCIFFLGEKPDEIVDVLLLATLHAKALCSLWASKSNLQQSGEDENEVRRQVR